MRTQEQPPAPQRQQAPQRHEREAQYQNQEAPNQDDGDPFEERRGRPATYGRGREPIQADKGAASNDEAAPPEPMPPATLRPDAMQDSQLAGTAGRGRESGKELDGIDEMGAALNWVSLDSPRGLLVCKNLDIEVPQFVGIILESRVVRVMKEGDGTVCCASSDRQVADVGRPGRECGPCEDRGVSCFPRWWIAWQEERQEERAEGEGQIFAHTLSQTGTLNFTRYVAKLRRDGLRPSQVQTRLFVEEARRQKAGTVYRRLQFERADPFA